MAEIQCARCGSRSEGLARAPLPGPVGEAVLEQVCPACWDEWRRVQVKLINEYRIEVTDPGQYDRLIGEMTVFLNLRRD
jgi:Fe-S cluster biosynthesis and repair protein YggX